MVGGPVGAEIQAFTGTSGAVAVREGSYLYTVARVVGGSAAQRLLPAEAVGPFALGDPNHMLAFGCDVATEPGSCQNPHFFTTADGGSSWAQAPVLERLLTRDSIGTYSLDATSNPLWGQATSAAIDPQNNQIMAVGALDTGIMTTGDGGTSWQRSVTLPLISKLRFSTNGILWGTSFGRGVFHYQPRPPTLRLTQHFQGNTPVFDAVLHNPSGAPQAGVTVTFTNLDGTTGQPHPAGSGVTDSTGTVQLVNPPTNGGYLLADINGQGFGQLETQTTVLGN